MPHYQTTKHLDIKGEGPLKGLAPLLEDLIERFPHIGSIIVNRAKKGGKAGRFPNNGFNAIGYGSENDRICQMIYVNVSCNGDFSGDEKRFLQENGACQNGNNADDKRREILDRRADIIKKYLVDKYWRNGN